MRTRCTPLVPVLALAAALVACGGGGVKKADFTAKADAACAPGNGAIAAVAKPSNAAQVATAAGTAVTTIDAQVVALRALERPGGDAGQAAVEGAIAGIAGVAVPLKALQEAAGKSDDAAMAKAAVEVQSKVDAAALSAQAYGLTQCGTGLKPAILPLFEGSKAVVKTTYVAKGEALCRASERKSQALGEPTSPAAFGRFIDRYLPIYNQLIADFKALVVPPGDEALITALVADFEASVPKIKEVGAAAKANNMRLFGALLEELDLAGTQIDAKLDAYGLKACGSEGGF